jgi:hypothetical protein
VRLFSTLIKKMTWYCNGLLHQGMLAVPIIVLGMQPLPGAGQEGQVPDERIGILLAAGDITGCFQSGGKYDKVSELIGKEIEKAATLPVGILVLGDLAYANRDKTGKITRPTYAECFEVFKDRWGKPYYDKLLPVMGNHDLTDDPSKGGMFRQFFKDKLKTLRADEKASFYAVKFPNHPDGWLVAGLNLYSGTDRQREWLTQELRSASERCVLAFAHPFLNSSGHHGRKLANWTYAGMQPFMKILYDEGATVLITGHDHHFEQFGRQDSSGNPVIDDVKGVRSFIVGTGGATLYRVPDGRRHRLSEYFTNKSWGLLKLELYVDRYTWSFVSAAGEAVNLPVKGELCSNR